MGFLNNYRKRMRDITGPESAAGLTEMEWFFQGGKNWTRGAYHRPNGSACLVGAAEVARFRAPPLGDARYWLQQAVAERHPGMSIEAFNDSRTSFSEIAEILARAKQLALANGQSPPRPRLTYQPEEERPVVTLDLADLERVAVKRK